MTDLALIEFLVLSQEDQHRFPPIVYRGDQWDLSHLDSFAVRTDLGGDRCLEVLVLFSCHCFTHAIDKDARAPADIPLAEIYDDGRERRVLDPQRYVLSRRELRAIVTKLPSTGHIQVANERIGNFRTVSLIDEHGAEVVYGIFFEAERDKKRKGRVLVRIQSAYVLEDGLTKRQQQAKKVNWKTLIKATYERRTIKA